MLTPRDGSGQAGRVAVQPRSAQYPPLRGPDALRSVFALGALAADRHVLRLYPEVVLRCSFRLHPVAKRAPSERQTAVTERLMDQGGAVDRPAAGLEGPPPAFACAPHRGVRRGL